MKKNVRPLNGRNWYPFPGRGGVNWGFVNFINYSIFYDQWLYFLYQTSNIVINTMYLRGGRIVFVATNLTTEKFWWAGSSRRILAQTFFNSKGLHARLLQKVVFFGIQPHNFDFFAPKIDNYMNPTKYIWRRAVWIEAKRTKHFYTASLTNFSIFLYTLSNRKFTSNY